MDPAPPRSRPRFRLQSRSHRLALIVALALALVAVPYGVVRLVAGGDPSDPAPAGAVAWQDEPSAAALAAYGDPRAARPKAEQFYFEPLKETQRVYSKPFRITLPITLVQNAALPLTIKGTVKYQACDDAICYLPQTIAVSWKVGMKK